MKFGDVLKERLEESMRDEQKSGSFYRELAKLVKDSADKKIIMGLVADEDRHFKELKQLYTKTYPDGDLDLALKDDSAQPRGEDKKMLEGRRKASYEPSDILKESTAAVNELELEGEAFYGVAEMLVEQGLYDTEEEAEQWGYTNEVDTKDAESFMKRNLEEAVSGLKVLSVEFLEYDSGNVSHASMYFKVKVKGNPEVLLRASEEGVGLITFSEEDIKKLKGSQGPSPKKVKSSSIIALSKVTDFDGLISMQRRFASVIKVAEVKDTEASRLVECFHDGEKFILCHKYDGQIVLPVGSKYMVVVGSHHVTPFDEGFVYINSYTGEVSSKDMDEVKQTLFPEIIAELRRQGMEFEPDLKKAPEVSKAMEEMFKSTDNYQKAIFDILK